jgi:hypothetical protein
MPFRLKLCFPRISRQAELLQVTLGAALISSMESALPAQASPGQSIAITLEGTRTATNTGEFSRTTDLATSLGGIYQFSINVTSLTGAGTSSLVFQVGSNFTTLNSAETNANTHSRFSINLLTTPTANSYMFRDINTSTNGTNTFTGMENVFFVVNNTGSTFTYTAPDASSQMVANDTWDLWVGTTQQFNDRAATTGTISPTDFKMTWSAGAGTIQFDNFSITAILEPSTWLASALALGAIACSQRKRIAAMLTARVEARR